MKILVTGANGYIGRRLLPILVMDGHDVVCLLRDKRRIELEPNIEKQITYVEADLLDYESVKKIPKDIDVAYYLVHSMGANVCGPTNRGRGGDPEHTRWLERKPRDRPTRPLCK